MRYDTWTSGRTTDGMPLIDAIMDSRGLHGEEAARFLEAPLSLLHDPFLLPDMDKAVGRLNRALDSGEHIMVYGDYDVDGATACALLAGYLRSRGAKCGYFIPRRVSQGYGLHAAALEDFRESGVTLVVTVDVGVTAFEAALKAREIGMDLIITDHHTCRETLPDAVAVINPKRPDSGYPFVELAGVGVAFKLICALEPPENAGRLLEEYGDLTALGTVADVMPLCGENRVLVKRGLSVLEAGKRPGLRQLLSRTCMNGRQHVTANTVSYGMAPVLNAAGRMADATSAVELMLTSDELAAEQSACTLFDLNSRRRELETRMYQEIVRRLESQPGWESQPAVVMSCEDWHPGVTGIVCARLLEKYRKPVFLIAIEDAGGVPVGKGSARSPAGVDLPALLAACGHTLKNFGGHAAAAGFSVELENIELFKKTLYEALESLPPAEAAPAALYIDVAVNACELTVDNAEALQRLGPFGARNPEPVLMLENAELLQVIPLKDGKHLKLLISSGNRRFHVICFGFEAAGFPYAEGDRVDLAFVLSLHSFRNETNVQLELKDIRMAAETARRYAAERELYGRFLEGGELLPHEFRQLTPTRDDLVVVWRHLNRLADTLCQVNVWAHALLRGIAADSPRIGMARLLAALDVFGELTLIRCEQDGEMLHISLCGDDRKVNLLDSKLLKRMASCPAGEEPEK